MPPLNYHERTRVEAFGETKQWAEPDGTGSSCRTGYHNECGHPDAVLNDPDGVWRPPFPSGPCNCICHTVKTRFPEGAEL